MTTRDDLQAAATAPSPIVGVATAVPAFIGYTEKAETADGEPAVLTPLQVSSLAEFEGLFGGGAPAGYNLYDSLRLFYANGGGLCWIVAVGTYEQPVAYEALRQGLDTIGAQSGPTMLVIPDAVLLPPTGPPAWTAPPEYWELVTAMIDQAATLGDRVAILDVYGSDAVQDASTFSAVVEQFQAKIRGSDLSYGVAYFPFLQTSLAQPGEAGSAAVPPSGALAGFYTEIDANVGVWQAPANVSLLSVVRPTFEVTSEQQGELNAPLNGVAINAIRDIIDRGAVVWGARTLGGNSLDYRYIQVRRELIYIEQSIKNALNQFVFAPNDANTWITVTSMISSFLQGLWSQGGLMGVTANEAYTVQCGLGSTMTEQDILDGYMRVQVLLSMVRPLEFIELTFRQKMEGVG